MQAAAEAAAKAAASQVAYGGTTDGKTIYDNLCNSCHTAGVAGAPKLGDKAMWGPRIAEGLDTLIKHAIEGYNGPDGNFMPAKGGNPALTDEQVKAAVHLDRRSGQVSLIQSSIRKRRLRAAFSFASSPLRGEGWDEGRVLAEPTARCSHR